MSAAEDFQRQLHSQYHAHILTDIQTARNDASEGGSMHSSFLTTEHRVKQCKDWAACRSLLPLPLALLLPPRPRAAGSSAVPTSSMSLNSSNTALAAAGPARGLHRAGGAVAGRAHASRSAVLNAARACVTRRQQLRVPPWQTAPRELVPELEDLMVSMPKRGKISGPAGTSACAHRSWELANLTGGIGSSPRWRLERMQHVRSLLCPLTRCWHLGVGSSEFT